MKKLLLFFCLLLTSLGSKAHDFEVNGIYYNITSSSSPYTVEVTYRGNRPSSYNEYIGSFTIPESVTNNSKTYSVTSIGSEAFYGCSGLASITIPNSVTSIGGYAFYECSDLTSITIPNSMTSISSFTFQNCSGLTSVTIPNSVTSIGSHAFSGCTGLTSITIPNSVTSIGMGAFRYCYDLTSVTIPNSVTSIAGSAFSDCRGLTSITIPNSVTSIGGGLFSGCCSLETIAVNSGNMVYDSREGCNAIIETVSNTLIAGCKNAIIPNSVTSIGEAAFSDCSDLTSVIIPNSVTSIAGSAFSDCRGLTSVTISNNVTSIGGSAFRNCTNLSSVIIPNSVANIGKWAFDGCEALNLIYCDREEPPSAKDDSFPNGVSAIIPNNVAAYKTALGWRNLAINIPFALRGTTQSTITLRTSAYFTDQKVVYGGVTYTPSNGIVKITNLAPNKKYSIPVTGKYEGKELSAVVTAQTKTIYVSNVWRIDRTNTTLTIFCGNSDNVHEASSWWGAYDAGDAIVTYAGFENYGMGSDYEFSSNAPIIGTRNFKGKKIVIDGLVPGKEYSFSFVVKTSDGSEFRSTGSSQTLDITAKGSAIMQTASSATLKGELQDLIDATIESIGFEENEYKSDELKFCGLKPNTSYSKTFKATFKEGGSVTADITFKTSSLTLETLQPKVISEGNVIVAAKSNLDDEETNVGFEWRRQDWNDDFDSKTGGAYLYNGEMEGYIRNLNANYLWKFRPYYEANDGTRYYGEWKGLDPSDYSYFEPTVHTYANVTVNENTAMVKGYAQRGTDNVTSQGFLYWPNDGNYVKAEQPMRVTEVPDDAKKVTAKGTVMTAKLTGLSYNTTYSYVAFVETSEGETFYGEEMTFQTDDDLTGIEPIHNAPSIMHNEEAIYDLQGRRQTKMQKGINIIRMSNGTTRKVLVM